ncbi:twin-arginine translocase TatA/TatE family subunit [Paenibacillus sp. WQ 127069]|uniref:Sec-independent protein translocase protein TatA n=1 Tax=Paenibacillus baimaensis TaxID=2982185 RepID=A0ABT2UFT0_9BACL|nr:twin-arginine translocase TatA/TatE family subunit [Paenibacillus sp. WQ 127069]MCU6793465.1 twin-arginine translocase TatA/TatE family subunit [Paenibacillus sp. WQ 127069]
MSITHILLIAVVALILFGPNKLPELGRALGKTLRDFKNGANDLMSAATESEPEKERKDVTPPSQPAAPAAASQQESVVQPSPQASTQQKDSRRLPE